MPASVLTPPSCVSSDFGPDGASIFKELLAIQRDFTPQLPISIHGVSSEPHSDVRYLRYCRNAESEATAGITLLLGLEDFSDLLVFPAPL